MAYTTINKSTDYFNTKLYTGNGSTNSVTVGFQPDFIWLKSRDTGTANHCLMDVIRGFGTGSNNTPLINSNTTDAEFQRDVFSSTGITSTGYELDTYSDTNANGDNFVGWNWKANGAGSANTDGSINSTVSANTTAGFSIVKYTGYGGVSTVGHGLGVAPNLIINKNFESGSTSWFVGLIDWTKRLKLEGTNTWSANTVWNDTAPTNQVFSLNGTNANSSGQDYIAYCFAEKTGYSKFGSYLGNGNADGTFVYTGFKPAFVLVKNTQQSTDNWFIWDNKRPGYNQTQKYLSPNNNSAEADSSSFAIDTLSNGFKVRASTGAINNNGETIVYMAFGQSLVGSNNIPATAR